jgi:hypothetical protein
LCPPEPLESRRRQPWTRAFALLAATLTLLIATRSQAAPPPPPSNQHTLGVSLGYADYGVADRAASALVYRGTTGAGRLDYAGERPHLRWSASLGFAMGPYYAANHPDRVAVFGTVGVDGKTEDIEVPMRGRTLVPTASLGLEGQWSFGRVTLLAGGSLDYELFYAQGFVSAGLMQSLAARPSLRVRVDASAAHRVDVGASTPIVAWVVRMPYHQSVSVPHERPVAGLIRLGSTVQGPASMQGVSVDGGYRYRINHRVGVTARYRFAWLRNEAPRLLSRAEQQLLLGVEVYL